MPRPPLRVSGTRQGGTAWAASRMARAMRAFSTVELVTAMAVIAVLGIIAVPAYQRTLDDGHDRAGAQGVTEVARSLQARMALERSTTPTAALVEAAIVDVVTRPPSRDQEPIRFRAVQTASTSPTEVSYAVLAGAGTTRVGFALRSKSGDCVFALVQDVETYDTWSAEVSPSGCVGSGAAQRP